MRKMIAILLVLAMAMGAFLALAEGTTAYEAMSKGSKGDAVKALQERLKELGYYSIAVDGDYGNGTVKAVTAFQA